MVFKKITNRGKHLRKEKIIETSNFITTNRIEISADKENVTQDNTNQSNNETPKLKLAKTTIRRKFNKYYYKKKWYA